MVRESGAEIDGWGGGRFDLVGSDPRGTNTNTPVQCFTSEASGTWPGGDPDDRPHRTRTSTKSLATQAPGSRLRAGAPVMEGLLHLRPELSSGAMSVATYRRVSRRALRMYTSEKSP